MAQQASAGICNLGLEQQHVWGSSRAEDDLLGAFAAGWSALHELSLFVARELIAVLKDVRCLDDEIQHDLDILRRALVRHCHDGEPWRARGALEVVAMLDMPVFVALQALLDECPVLPEAVTATLERRARAISPTAFEFIGTSKQVGDVQAFAGMLLDALTR